MQRGVEMTGERGVVLIVALIILVIISLLATFSIRNAVSTEALSGNVRTTQLATQAAEIALRYCEDGLQQSFNPTTPTLVISPLPPVAGDPDPKRGFVVNYEPLSPTKWNVPNLLYWDTSTSLTGSSPTYVITVPPSYIGGSVTFRRAPECMIEHVPVTTASGTTTFTSTYVITARGFGPEVAAVDSTRKAPTGSEAWMQSTISFK